jgi:hypothetical protein
VNEFSARDPKTIEAELKDIYEWILCTTTIYIVNKKNWIRMFVIVDALNHSSLSHPYSIFPNFSFRIFVLLIPTCLCNYVSDRILPAATVRTI